MTYYISFIILPIVVAMRNEEINEMVKERSETLIMRFCVCPLVKNRARRAIEQAIPAHAEKMTGHEMPGPIRESQIIPEHIATSSQSSNDNQCYEHGK